MSHKKKFVALVCILSIFSFGSLGLATDADKAPIQEDTEWSEDMDAKIDTAIEVLGAVKEELKEYQKTEAKLKGKEWEETVPQKVSAIVRLWRRIRKIVGADKELTPEEEAKMTKELNERIDKTIKMMSAIKEELDKIEAEEAEEAEEAQD